MQYALAGLSSTPSWPLAMLAIVQPRESACAVRCTATAAAAGVVDAADHPDTLLSRNNLAYAYESVGRLREAIPPA